MTDDRPEPGPLASMAAALEGAQVPGGCDQCAAYQTVERDSEYPSLTHLTTHHDEWCPFLAARSYLRSRPPGHRR